MPKTWKLSAVGLMMVVGLSLMLWPVIHGGVQDKAMAAAAQDFLATLPTGIREPESTAPMSVEAPSQSTEPDPLREAMEEFNALLRRDQAVMWSQLRYDVSGIDLADYGITDGVVAALEIPRLDIVLPVYLGASDHNLRNGAAVVGFNSMPIGGAGSCCVIAAHRSYRGAAYFRDIDSLEPGDTVILTNRWERMIYQVTGQQITAPEDTQPLSIQPGEDLLILYTCHPMYSLRQRLLVFCKRTEN